MKAQNGPKVREMEEPTPNAYTISFRIFFLGFLAALGVGGMYALTIFVEPEPREMSQRIPTRDLFDNK